VEADDETKAADDHEGILATLEALRQRWRFEIGLGRDLIAP